MDLLSDKQMFE